MKYQSKLSNILLAACAKSSSISKYGVDSVLAVLVKDIQKLDTTGLTISCSGFEGTVRCWNTDASIPPSMQVPGCNVGATKSLPQDIRNSNLQC